MGASKDCGGRRGWCDGTCRAASPTPDEKSYEERVASWAERYIANVEKCATLDALTLLQERQSERREEIRAKLPHIWKRILDAENGKFHSLSTPGESEPQREDLFGG